MFLNKKCISLTLLYLVTLTNVAKSDDGVIHDYIGKQSVYLRSMFIEIGYISENIYEKETGAPFCVYCPKPNYKIRHDISYVDLKNKIKDAANELGLILSSEDFPYLTYDWVTFQGGTVSTITDNTKYRTELFIEVFPDENNNMSWLTIHQYNEKRHNKKYPWKKVNVDDIKLSRLLLKKIKDKL